MRLGDLTLHLVGDGEFRLDGGAMFGVVPKVLWREMRPPDESNRIRMATNCLLVERGGDLLLVDSGVGDKNDRKFRRLFGMEEGAPRLPDAIRGAGFEPGDVTHVVLTHLHFDHCGWNTRERNGRLVPTFSNATYWMARGEVEHARSPNERDRSGYDPRNWEPLFEAGVVELFGAEAEPLPGIQAVCAPGHTRDMAIVLLDGGPEPAGSREDGAQGIPQGARSAFEHRPQGHPAGRQDSEPAEWREDGAQGTPQGARSAFEHRPQGHPAGDKAVFWADLVPTAAHLPYPWIMSFDLYPMQTLEEKKRWIPRAAEEGWLCFFEHDPEVPCGRIVPGGRSGRWDVEPILEGVTA